MREKAVVQVVRVKYEDAGLWIEARCWKLSREILERSARTREQTVTTQDKKAEK